MVKEQDGLIYKGLYKYGLVTAKESSHYTDKQVNYILTNESYWDSNGDVLPAWFEIDFSFPLRLRKYSLKTSTVKYFPYSWRVFDSKNNLVHQNTENCFSEINQYLAFSFDHVVVTTSLKFIFDGTTSPGNDVAYIGRVDVYGSFSQEFYKFLGSVFVNLCTYQMKRTTSYMRCLTMLLILKS